MTMTPWPFLALCLFVSPVFSQSNGMDMSMDMPMNLAAANMIPYLHFTPGDTVWFLGWVPSSVGAMVGTCIGVFMLSILERWLAACIGLAERHWAERTDVLMIGKTDCITSPSLSGSSKLKASPPIPDKYKQRLPPFVAEFDIMRGILFAARKLVQTLLMLVVMTFQLAFIISIVVGSGVGETLFGRFSSSHEH